MSGTYLNLLALLEIPSPTQVQLEQPRPSAKT